MNLPSPTPSVLRSSMVAFGAAAHVQPSQISHHIACDDSSQKSCGPYDNNWCCNKDLNCGETYGECPAGGK